MKLRPPAPFDVLNFVIAGLRDGVMPLYNLYLVSQLGLTPIRVSWILTVVSAVGFLAQAPVGFLYDRARSARVVLSGDLVLLSGSSLMMFVAQGRGFGFLVATQVLFALATVILSQGIPAITVAETSSQGLGARVARNEVFAKLGNFATLGMAGYLTQVLSMRTIFVIVPFLTVPAVLLILRQSGEARVTRTKRSGLLEIELTRDMVALLAVTFFIYLANSSAMPLFEQIFATTQANAGAKWVTWGAAVAQGMITVTILSLAVVRKRSHLFGVMGLTLLVIGLRLVVMASGLAPSNLILSQILDGIIAGVVFTVPMRILADLDRAHFNVLASGLGAAATGASALSNLASGYALTWFAYPAAFLVYLGPVAVGFAVTVTYLLLNLRSFGRGQAT